MHRFAWALSILILALVPPALAQPSGRVFHALSLTGEPKYGPDFQHLDYVNPDAPKGGELKQFDIGGFDSLNPFIVKGEAAPGVGLIFEALVDSPRDDVTAEYGLIAKSIEVPDDLSWVAFEIRPEARWHDGRPITAEDVIWSFETLKEKGQPIYRFYYANVARAEALGPRKVKFHFTGPRNRELPQIMGQLTILPKHYWEGRDFEKSTLDPPLGSGPYRIKSVEANRAIVFERVADYWGRDLPLNRGRYNFDIIRYDSYRDTTVALEAFKAHQYDFRVENSAKNWATAYDVAQVRDGQIRLERVKHARPTGMQSFVFNTRRAKFADARVRYALGHAFDFEWSNKNLFFDQYTRTESYFSNSELAAAGLPSAVELKLLEPLRAQIPTEVFTKEYRPPTTDGSGELRTNLRAATKLLSDAGWTVKNKLLTGPDGKPMEIEFLLSQPEFERVVQPFARNLERLGVVLRIRTVDTAQYINRVRDFDFDMMLGSWGQSDSPGNEQRDYWSAAAADRPGSRNLAGIKNPGVDALVEAIVAAPDRPALIAASRALDRVLLWNHYVAPNWHIATDRIAYWNKFARQGAHPKYGPDLMSWWIDPAKAAQLGKPEPARN